MQSAAPRKEAIPAAARLGSSSLGMALGDRLVAEHGPSVCMAARVTSSLLGHRRWREGIMSRFSALFGSHSTSVSVCDPQHKKNIKKIEQVHPRVSIWGLEPQSFEETLKELGFSSLEKTHLRTGTNSSFPVPMGRLANRWGQALQSRAQQENKRQ